MRALVSRGLLVSPLVCAALVCGPAAADAAAADAGRAASGRGVAQQALPAGTDLATLLDRLDATHGSRLVSPFLATVPGLAAAHGNRLDPATAAAYAQAVRKWSDTVQESIRAAATRAAGHRQQTRAADPVTDLVNAIQAAVGKLLTSLTSLDLGGVISAVTGLLAPVLDAVTGLLGSLAPALPALPALPAADTVTSTATTVAP
ncbi:hypothetical protein AB0958_15205 [Streptomyces sp. NPDC006655]|uniref:hypothetical protein n=1 Tax=Streptomyces sp. NPDC006655 TaxID=3156898 RepID=UPI0034550760